jgi:hypothetical protein
MLNPGISSKAARVAAHPSIVSNSPKKFQFLKKSCSLFVLFSLLVTADCFGGVVIHEIMYHPASGNVLESYVELRNLDNVATNISGWHFTKGIQFTFPTNTTLGPSAYLVVAADRSTFTNKYPGVANFVAGFTGTVGHHLKLAIRR